MFAMFLTILIGLTPAFLLVGLGGLVRQRLSERAWQGLDKLNFEVLFPALLFVSAATREIQISSIAIIGPAIWALSLLAAGAVWLVRAQGPERFLDFAGAWQTSWRFNAAMAFVAAGASQGSDLGLMAVCVGMAVPFANLLAVSALSRGSSLGLRETVLKVVLNPFLLSSLGGVAVGLSGLALPAPVVAPLEMLGAASIPIALISIGATMKWRALTRLTVFTGYISAVKLLFLPAAALAVPLALGLPSPEAVAVVVWAALPTATASHILAAAFGADRELPARLVAQTMLISALTLPVWIALADTLLAATGN